MQRLPLDEKVRLVVPYLERAGLRALAAAGGVRAKVTHVVEAAGDRIKTAGDILDFGYFFLEDSWLSYDEKAFEKSLGKPGAAELLAKFRDRLATAEPFDAAHLEQLLHQFVEEEGIKIGDIIHSGPRGDHRPVGRPGAVRQPGDSGQGDEPAADRARDSPGRGGEGVSSDTTPGHRVQPASAENHVHC